jgi:hypothetical protein
MAWWSNKKKEPVVAAVVEPTEAELHEEAIPKFTKEPQEAKDGYRHTRVRPHIENFSFYETNMLMDGLVTTHIENKENNTSIRIWPDDTLKSGTETLQYRNHRSHPEDIDPQKLQQSNKVINALADYFAQKGYKCVVKRAKPKEGAKEDKAAWLQIAVPTSKFKDCLKDIQRELMDIEKSYIKYNDGSTEGRLGAIEAPEYAFHTKAHAETKWTERNKRIDRNIDDVMKMARSSFHINSTVSEHDFDTMREELETYFSRSR